MRSFKSEHVLQARGASLAYVYQKANRILSSLPVTCKFDDGYPAPAWSIGASVFFNENLIPDTYTTEGMIAFTGVNYHELCHVMFTPTSEHATSNWAMNNGMRPAMNILEDQRIESLMVAKYRSTAAYFTSMFVRHVLDAKNGDVNKTFLLSYGRRYLPARLRKALRDMFVAKYGEPMAREAERIIDAYRKVVFRASDVKNSPEFLHQTELIRRFNALMSDVGDQDMPDDPYGHSQTDRDDPQVSGDRTSTRDKEENQESAAEEQSKTDREGDQAYEQFDGSDNDDSDADSDDDSDDDAEDGSEGAGDDDSDDADGDDDGQGQGDGDDAGDEEGDGESESGSGSGDQDDADASDGDGDSDGDGESSTSGTNKGSGKGATAGDNQNQPEDIRDIAEDIDNAVQDSTQVKRDVRDWQERVSNNVGKVLYGSQQFYVERQPKPEFMGASRRFGKELQRLWADADPGWNKHQATGRLSMQRAMTGGDMDTIWDQWDEGKNDATDIEMVLLVDCSISMDTQMAEASQASWAIKRAVEQVGGHVTVLGYSDSHTIHYPRYQRATTKYRGFHDLNGTNPTTALQQAQIAFNRSKAHHKLLVVITDGAWPYNVVNESESRIEEMNRSGVATALGFLADPHLRAQYGGNSHRCQVYADMSDPMGIVGLAKQMVKQAMKS